MSKSSTFHSAQESKKQNSKSTRGTELDVLDFVVEDRGRNNRFEVEVAEHFEVFVRFVVPASKELREGPGKQKEDMDRKVKEVPDLEILEPILLKPIPGQSAKITALPLWFIVHYRQVTQDLFVGFRPC